MNTEEKNEIEALFNWTSYEDFEIRTMGVLQRIMDYAVSTMESMPPAKIKGFKNRIATWIYNKWGN